MFYLISLKLMSYMTYMFKKLPKEIAVIYRNKPFFLAQKRKMKLEVFGIKTLFENKNLFFCIVARIKCAKHERLRHFYR